MALIGVGFGEAVLAPALRRDARVRLVSVCASTQESARASAARLGVATALDDWRLAVADPDVDAVAIAVPPTLQPEIIREAAKRHKHVFCEKPVGVDGRSTEGLLEAVTAANIAHAVDFEFGELASWQRARSVRLATETWRHFALSWRVETRANRLGGHPWKTSHERGGGALLSFVSHVVYGVEWMIGRITKVSAVLAPRGAPAEARVDALVELEGGLTGTLSVATDAVHGSGFRLELYGDDQMMLLENQSSDHLRNYVLSTRARDDGARVVLVDERVPTDERLPDGRIEPVSSLTRRFVDAALGGPRVHPGLEEGLRVGSVLEAMRQAHQRQVWLPTP